RFPSRERGEPRRTTPGRDRTVSKGKRRSWLPPAVQSLASRSDLGFHLVEKGFIVLADRVYQAGDQQLARGSGRSQQARDQVARPHLFELQPRDSGRIIVRALHFAPVQQTLLEETVDGGHHRGVRQRPRQFLSDVVYLAFALHPENFHHGDLEMAQSRCGRRMPGSALFEQTHHLRRDQPERLLGPTPNAFESIRLLAVPQRSGTRLYPGPQREQGT